MALESLVLGAALWELDGDGREAEGGEVIGAGAHVYLADVAGELEAIGDERGRGQGDEFVGPFVEVHVRVEAAALLEVCGCGTLELVAIEGTGLGGEEAKGVVVGAAEGLGLDD